MSQRVVFNRPGPPEVMRLEEHNLEAPGAGELRVRHTAIGVNFIDVYHRSGAYPLAQPSGLGMEAVGVVEAVGAGVTGFRVGQKVAYATPPLGAYATVRNYPAQRLVHVPPNLDDAQVAAGLVKGLTAWFLLHRTHRLVPHQNVLIYAAAGGVGQILARWARHLGANVFGIVGSEEKREHALWAGCEEVFLLSDDYVGALAERGRMHVVYDSLGAVSFERSLNCLRPLGMMVSFGNASGAPPALAPSVLLEKGSLFLTRPSLMDYVADHAELEAGWEQLAQLMIEGVINCSPSQEFALADVVQAHRALESRQTTGSTILRP